MPPVPLRPTSRSSRRTSVLALLPALLAVAGIAGCGPSSTSDTTGTGRGALVVSAAASLTEVFAAEEAAFEAIHPDVRVTINSAASSTLATQILTGAPVDVLASADQENMTKVADAGLLASDPVTFATNSLRIVVPRGNPRGVDDLADLAEPGIVTVTCGPDVPIGRYTSQVLQRAGITVAPRSLEPDVKGIIAKVTAGEADAGIVYATDVRATNGAVTGIEIPASLNVITTYPIAVVTTSSNRVAAQLWIAFILSAEGQRILRDHGFGAP